LKFILNETNVEATAPMRVQH